MLGDATLFPDAILSDDFSTYVPEDAPAPDEINPNGFIFVHDTWGGITIPVIAPPAGIGPQAIGDPTLSVILSFLKAYLVTDKNLTVAWSLVNPALPPINRTFPHNPNEIKFSTAHLPAIYMWRASGSLEWAAEDWMRDTSVVTALWVFPLGSQENQSIRAPFVNAMIKATIDGIETGRTPSWVMPNDQDQNAKTAGSFFYPFANFEQFLFVSWKPSKLIIQSADDNPNEEYPAIEMTFQMQENFVDGLDAYALLNAATGGSITVMNELGLTTDVAIMMSPPPHGGQIP